MNPMEVNISGISAYGVAVQIEASDATRIGLLFCLVVILALGAFAQARMIKKIRKQDSIFSPRAAFRTFGTIELYWFAIALVAASAVVGVIFSLKV